MPSPLNEPVAGRPVVEATLRLPDGTIVWVPLTLVYSGWTRASVLLDTTLTASDPANVTPLLPPAPEVECAAKLEAPGPIASTVTPPPAVRFVLPARYASVLITATLTPIAMPTPDLSSSVGRSPSGVLLVVS